MLDPVETDQIFDCQVGEDFDEDLIWEIVDCLSHNAGAVLLIRSHVY